MCEWVVSICYNYHTLPRFHVVSILTIQISHIFQAFQEEIKRGKPQGSRKGSHKPSITIKVRIGNIVETLQVVVIDKDC